LAAAAAKEAGMEHNRNNNGPFSFTQNNHLIRRVMPQARTDSWGLYCYRARTDRMPMTSARWKKVPMHVDEDSCHWKLVVVHLLLDLICVRMFRSLSQEMPNELWHVRACVTTVTFELVIDGFGNKRLGSVNVQ
jgi:hypothetical protein